MAGPESAIYKSTDAGKTWRKMTRGLPGRDLGRIGLAVSPIQPDVVYALVEAAEDQSGCFKSHGRRRDLVEAEQLQVRQPAVLSGTRRLPARVRSHLFAGHVHDGLGGRRQDVPSRWASNSSMWTITPW